MRIGFIGAGRVGCTLGKYLVQSDGGWELMGYYSRRTQSAAEAADFTGSRVYDKMEALVEDCEAVFLTTPDDTLRSVWDELCALPLSLDGRLVIHCSGACDCGMFPIPSGCTVTLAGLHPFYAVSDRFHSYETIGNALFTLEGSGARLTELSECLSASGLYIQPIRSEDKTAYHAAAAVASNLMVALTELSIQTLTRCGFDRAHARMALRPLMQGNLDAVMERDTAQALTGPAERADTQTVQKHLQVLNGEEREIYRLLTKQLIPIAAEKNPDRDYRELMKLLG